MGKRGRRSEEKSAGARAASACSALHECPYRVCSSANDGFLSSGFGLGSGFGSCAGAGVGAGVADDSGSDAAQTPARHASAAVVESARTDHVGRRERGGVELASASVVETASTREVRRRRRNDNQDAEDLLNSQNTAMARKRVVS
jgi:hypothetical protein